MSAAHAGRGGVLADREFQGLWVAQGLSLAGDQLARVAVAILVFARTDSAVLTAGAYAVSFLPWLAAGPLLGGLGDRLPRRTVMIGCDLCSAGLVAVLTVPGIGLPGMYALLFALVLVAAPFSSARAALIRDVFPDDRYAAATALGNITGQAAQVAGFGLGGALVAAVGPTAALGFDAATFVISAVVVRAAVRHRPAAGGAASGERSSTADGLRLVFGDRRLRRLALFAWLAAFHLVPNGVVVPYVARLGGGPTAVGVLLASSAAGTAAGMVALTRWASQRRRVELMPALAIAAAAPLALCALDPGLAPTAALWFAAGIGSGYQLGANVAFVSAVPDALRARAFAVVGTGLVAGQGLAVLIAGALAETVAPHLVVAGAGVLGSVAAVALSVSRVDGVRRGG